MRIYIFLQKIISKRLNKPKTYFIFKFELNRNKKSLYLCKPKFLVQKNMEEKNKLTLLQRLRKKYRLIVYTDKTFEERKHFRLSKMDIITFLVSFFLVSTILVTTLFVFTPLKNLIPKRPDPIIDKKLAHNVYRVDSLAKEIAIRDKYLDNLKRVISGETPEEIVQDLAKRDSLIANENMDFTKSETDSLLRKEVEAVEKVNLQAGSKSKNKNFSHLHFFAPINKGMLIEKFNSKERHYGVDIVAKSNSGILAVLDGTVITAEWTLATGYVLQIQHENDLVSFYKHNSVLLKKVGDRVSAGETIAIIGNSGEQTTGPHLHFELWHKGIPLNPEDYIVF